MENNRNLKITLKSDDDIEIAIQNYSNLVDHSCSISTNYGLKNSHTKKNILRPSPNKNINTKNSSN